MSLSYASALTSLAKSQCPDLSPAELQMFNQAARGGEADYTMSGKGQPIRLGRDLAPNPDNTIRASVMRWMCIDKDANRYVDPHGIRLTCAYIEGTLDLTFAVVPFPIVLSRCHVSGAILAQHAAMPVLNLTGSYCGPVFADGIKVDGDLVLRDGFYSNGALHLLGATVTGTFSCRNATLALQKIQGLATLDRRNIEALAADGMTVGGVLHLGGDFHARGQVALRGAKIGGTVICSGGKFYNQGGSAIDADGIEVNGSVNFNKGFRAYGEVRLNGAIIGGDLDCQGGVFYNRKAKALTIDGGEIGRNLRVDSGFRANGQVWLVNTNIAGNLYCRNACCLCSSSNIGSIVADGVNIQQSVLFDMGFRTNGIVMLNGATVGGELSFTFARFLGKRINGLSAVRTTINDSLHWQHISKTDKTQLDLRHARVGILADEETSWPSNGELILDGFVYDAIANGSPADFTKRRDWLLRQYASRNASSRPLTHTESDVSFYPQPYIQLASVYRNTGHDKEAQKTGILKEDMRREHGGLSVPMRAGNWLLKIIIGNGYKPLRALPWALAFIVLGFVFFWHGYKDGHIAPSRTTAHWSEHYQAYSLPESYPRFDAFFYSVDTFLPIVDLHQESYWLPNANRSSWLRLYFWLHIALGWSLTTLFVLGFTKIVRRD